MDKTSNISSLKLSPDKKYIVTDKNKPFFWLADTWWFGATVRMAWPQPFKTMVLDRKKKGFSVIQLVVGYPPEVDLDSEDTKNSGGYPFDKNGDINKNYFEEVDKKIKFLIENDLVPCIVGGWGHHIDSLGINKIKELWQEIIKRYSHYPVVFCLAGELDLFESKNKAMISDKFITALVKRVLSPLPKPVKKKIQSPFVSNTSYYKERDISKLSPRIKKWNEIAKFITETDTNENLITAHISQQKTADDLLGHPNWLSVNSIQSGHSKDVIPFMVNSILHSPKMIINMEPWYEGILSDFDDYYQRVAFWLCILSGAKGHSYGAHGIWQMADGDNFMKHWGKSDWRKSKDFLGAIQLGKSKELLKKYEWWKLSPNFKIINPCWTSENPMNPVAAEIKNKQIIIYFPDLSLNKKYELTFPVKRGNYEISWIDPKSMEEIKKDILKGNRLLPPKRAGDKDLLCILIQK
ncbi:MAG: DUF4038 domain-containing protein [Candidatus Levybacteria bacterium]|nr:DUF4038 domain-containing protein [Candidatus Levybacteria bacterium]